MKIAYLLALIPATLLINGCDDAESEVCRYYIQNDIDNANFESAIDRLEDKNCQDTYPNNEYLVDLSSAYLGKSGLPLPVILRALIEDEDSSEEFSFENFVSEISQSAEPSVLLDLDSSSSALDDYLNNVTCKSIQNTTSTEENICLITGFIDVLKTSMAIDVLAGGNVAAWADNENGDDPSMLRSSCALEYSNKHLNDVDFSIPFEDCKPGVTVDDSEEVTFTGSNGVTKTYNHLTISYDGVSEYFLESTTLGSTIFSNNYCQIDYAVCNDVEQGVCYTCPLGQGKEDLNVKDYLLNSLNSGFDSIEVGTQSSEDDEGSDIQESIDDFRLEIKSEGCSAVPEGEDCFTMDDIIDYLNKD